MSYIRIDFLRHSPSLKTDVWDVRTTDGKTLLGEIRWQAGWRRYAFFPDDMSFYEENCLREIAAFLETKMRERKG